MQVRWTAISHPTGATPVTCMPHILCLPEKPHGMRKCWVCCALSTHIPWRREWDPLVGSAQPQRGSPESSHTWRKGWAKAKKKTVHNWGREGHYTALQHCIGKKGIRVPSMGDPNQHPVHGPLLAQRHRISLSPGLSCLKDGRKLISP